MHIATECMIILQNITMSVAIIATVPDFSGDMLIFIWLSYLLGLLLKFGFYFGFHPWSELMRNDMMKTLKSWKNHREPVPAWNICSGENWLRCSISCDNCCCSRCKSCQYRSSESNPGDENVIEMEPLNSAQNEEENNASILNV